VALNAGAYSIGESGPNGYARSDSADCAGNIAVGQTKICTVTNDDIQPKLYVIKTVVNDNGGTAVASDFNMSVTGPSASPASFAGAANPGTLVSLNAGAFSVSESSVFGYTQTGAVGCSGNIAIGETKTCTFTNDDIQPKLYVIKSVINDNGGTATASSFTMSVTGSSPSPASFPGAASPGTAVLLNAGSYSVGETGASGYARTDSPDCAGAIAVGQIKYCTVTNNDIAPKLTVTKIVVSTTPDSGAFQLQINGVNYGTPGGDGATTGAITLNSAGPYTVGEQGVGTALADYVTTYGGACNASGQINLVVGDNKSCTITNTKKGRIIISNIAVPSVATPFPFTLKLGGSNVIPPFNLASGASQNSGLIAPGVAYVAAEMPPPGWTLATATCTNGNPGAIVVQPGGTTTCTFTNNNLAPTVVITGPPSGSLYPVNTPVNFTGTITDQYGDTHTAAWTFDLINQSGTVVQTPTGGNVNKSYSFASAGVYQVTLTVTDSAGQTAQANTVNGDPAFVVVYDPNGGFVTGGGWIMSTVPNALPVPQYMTVPGKANFGFVSKYQKGATVPTGDTEFQFKAGNMNFKSSSYEWLVVAGARAQFKGVGTINGSGSYGFLLTAVDSDVNGGGNVDTFRIKIWDKNNLDTIVYDNQLGAGDDSNAGTQLGGGSIVIHK